MRRIIPPMLLLLGLSLVACSSPQDYQDFNLEGELVNQAITRVISDPLDDTLAQMEADAKKGVVSNEALPDLVISTSRLSRSYSVQTESFSGTSCTAQEGGFSGGRYRTLRFDAATINIGTADLVVGDPSTQPQLFEWAPCHRHYHFRQFARYELIGVSNGKTFRARKQGFCMIDNYSTSQTTGVRQFFSCSFQGISASWGDIYSRNLSGQFFLLNDPTDPVPSGRYILRLTVNPPYTPTEGQACPVPMGNGQCRMFKESNYNNNSGEVTIRL